jgi:putative transposase
MGRPYKNINIYKRQTIRLKGYDYTQAGVYFVTLVSWQRQCLFGHVVKGMMILNDIGQIIQKEWQILSGHFPGIRLEELVVMPNHLHGIVVIEDNNRATRTVGGNTQSISQYATKEFGTSEDGSPLQQSEKELSVGAIRLLMKGSKYGKPSGNYQGKDLPRGSPLLRQNGPPPGSLGAVIGQLKSRATRRIWKLPGQNQVAIWQRNYYEHIVRNEREYQRIIEYIEANPTQWQEDMLYLG